ncbi:uncharacterized protein zgc:63972 isoform X2 [Etheostoma spectabile]|uniref:uncharacterized protein zgc:63972 isoform X2 n=1 Tax=Etheostoma spectabile TaxID=54343 RepID=UPI0013AF3AC0|nr:uncharacterized protein LOC116704480 isoform X2 [Etheostoma spectabile]
MSFLNVFLSQFSCLTGAVILVKKKKKKKRRNTNHPRRQSQRFYERSVSLFYYLPQPAGHWEWHLLPLAGWSGCGSGALKRLSSSLSFGRCCSFHVWAIMERRLAASINILSRTSTMYYWNGEIQDASEVLMLVKTKTSRIQQVIEYVRSVHPYENPEVLSFPVEDGNLAYMKWMDEAIPED